jgi:hypothetical protein
VTGSNETEGLQSVRQRRVGHTAVSPVRERMSSTAVSGGCQLRLRRTEIPPSPGKRIYPVPPVPPPAGSGASGEERGARLPSALREPWKAARCSTRCGEVADCSERETESQPKAPARSHCWQWLRFCAARQSTRDQGRGDSCDGESAKGGGGIAGGLKVRGNGRLLSVLRRPRRRAGYFYFFVLSRLSTVPMGR